MSKPRYTISASLPVDAGADIERFASVLGVSRSRLLLLCIRRALPLVLADAAATLNAAQIPAADLPGADLPTADSPLA